MRENGQYLVTHIKSYLDSLHIIFLIKYAFEYLFSALLLCVIANPSPPSLCPLLMVVLVKPSGGPNCRFERHHYTDNILINTALFLSGERRAVL